MRTFFSSINKFPILLTGPKKFPSHVVFVGGVKIFFFSLEAARAKRGLAFGVKVNTFKSLKIQNYCGKISLKPDEK